MKSFNSIGFIGGGNMAEAIIKGLIQGGVAAGSILVSEPNQARRDLLVERYGIELAAGSRDVVETCDLIVLAIKPQLTDEVLAGIAPFFTDAKLLVSILAGVTSRTLESHLKGSPRVIRVMPNTPALVGEGATALCPGAHASQDDLDAACRLFGAIGVVQTVGEYQMDAVTGLSGSGPAYVYTVIEALADGGVLEGLSREAALELAVQTVIGAARMVQQSGEHPAVLRDKVCSPAGTTIAAVRTLEEKGLRAALIGAVSSAAGRSRELGGK